MLRSPRRRTPGALSLALGAALLAAGLPPAGPGDAAPDPPQASAEGAWFEAVTEAAGVARPHRTRSFDNPYAHVMEGYTALGAAVAVGDFDGDGFDDL
ncbi:MAG TPA: hypothetical protein VLF66_03795, partial [Thermoanaerobaculia bacterium]|nr:hypothetical protein [Thermoanaerobaculia bacterium]